MSLADRSGAGSRSRSSQPAAARRVQHHEAVMMLEQRLHLLREKAAALIPTDALATMHRATEELRRSGILDRVVPKVGDRAPDFALESARGEVVRSETLLSKGPLVLDFYRGRW
jgi:hypothetical protein